jgi:hypothetical protein
VPGVLKLYMLLGFALGVAALALAISGRVVVIDDPHTAGPLGWRAALGVWGALAVLQAALILIRHPLGLYAFWALHAWYVLLAALYWLLLSGGNLSSSHVASRATVWSTLMALYGWYRRSWFLSKGERAQGVLGPSGASEGEHDQN